MTVVFLGAAAVIILMALAWLAVGPRTMAVAAVGGVILLATVSQHFAGLPASPDGRLALEQWRVLSVAPLEDDRFLVAVRFANGDLRAYAMAIKAPQQRDEFLKAAQGIRKGRSIVGRAARIRAGEIDDGGMGFNFNDAPEADPKARS